MRRLLPLLILLPSLLPAASVQITASHDNTLIEDATGALSDGAGPYFFVGQTAGGALRRGLLQFDVASAVPAGSTITSATLTLTMSKTGAGATNVTLQKVTSSWGEGTSNGVVGGSGGGGGGTGATSTTSDATWIHRFFNTQSWTTPGGDFSGTVSATQSVNGTGSYTWGPTTTMTADAQSWLDSPATNFGWVVRGNEASPHTAKRFNSRENGVTSQRPVLTIFYTTPSAVTDWQAVESRVH